MQENAELFNGYDEAQTISTRIARYSKQLTTIVDFGQKNHDKFLSTYGTGLTESLLAKQTKILFEHQIKQEIFHAQMLRLAKANLRSDFDQLDLKESQARATYEIFAAQNEDHDSSSLERFLSILGN